MKQNRYTDSNTKYMNINQTITLFVEGGGFRQVWRCRRAEACSLTFSLKVLLLYYAWEGSSVLWKCKHEASVDLPKLTCSCLACPLIGVGPYGWQCSLMESPCAVSIWMAVLADGVSLCRVHNCGRFFKITNTMSLVDYPLFSWVVVIHSLHVSSFLEAHHQEIVLPVQSAFWYIVFAVALPFSYVFCSRLW